MSALTATSSIQHPLMSLSTAAPESIWFLDTLVSVRVGIDMGSDGVSVLEHRARMGDSPPLHVHRSEDEIFHVLEGDLRIVLDDEERRLGAGDMLLAPKGGPHTYRVESETARWLTITSRGDFERFVRALGRRAERLELPPVSGPPSEEAMTRLVEIARAHRIDLVGPPLA